MSPETTWPHACTPASVRPAPTSSTGARTTVEIVRWSSPSTVRTPGLGAKPWNSVPSYATSSRTRRRSGPVMGSPGRAWRSDQLDARHLGVVAFARTELEDPRVAAVALDVPWGDVVDELVRHLAIAEVPLDLADAMYAHRTL